MEAMSGRPRKILNISIPLDLYWEIEEMAKKEYKTKGEFAREAIRQFIDKNKRWEEIREWGREAAERFGVESEEDVEKLIAQLREDSVDD
jgi:metal-responsive CopG/Arc/MetJ family transcriptional regulator